MSQNSRLPRKPNTFSKRLAMVLDFEQQVRVDAAVLWLLIDWWRDPGTDVDRVPES